MTTVHISLGRDDGTTKTAAKGVVEWEPTTRREDGAMVILERGFTVPLVAGEATVTVDPSGLTWCWRVTERTDSGGVVRYVSVPNSATTVEYVDLPDVDPTTLVAWSPADPEAAYQAALDAIGGGAGTVTSVDGIEPDESGNVSLSSTYVSYTALLGLLTEDPDHPGLYLFDSSPTPPDTTAPTVPANLTATAASHTSIALAWDASTDAVGVTGYEYRIDGGAAVDAGAGTTETVTGLTASTLYSFDVRAYDAAGNYSAYSAAATETTDATPADVTAPTVGTLAGSAETLDGFTLTASGAADETALHAQPYRFSTDDGTAYTAWQTSPVYAATGLDAGTAYTCKHQTRDAAENVSTGMAVVVTTVAPAALSLTATDNAVTLTDSTVYTFAGMDLGAEALDRTLIVVAGGRSASSVTVTGVTVGGVAATMDFSPAGNSTVGVARVALAAGLTGDVVVTFSGAMVRAGASVLRVTGGGTPAVSATSTSVGGNDATVVGAAGGFIVAGSFAGTNAAVTEVTWTNATRLTDDYVLESGTNYHMTAATSTATGSTAITHDGSGSLSKTAAVAYSLT